MFVLIEFQSVVNRFRSSVTNIKRIVNFVYSYQRFCNTCITNKKAHDLLASILVFLFCDTIEILQISGTQKKSENALCQYVKKFVLSLYAIGVW